MKCLVFADATDFARFQETEQLHLHRFVQFAEFVEEQRAAISDFQQPFAAHVGSGERPFAMSEELAFDELFRQRSAVDRDKGHRGPWAEVVNSSSDQLLAGSSFSENQHAGIRRSDLVDQAFDSLHGGGVADQFRSTLDRLEGFLQSDGLVQKRAVFGDAHQHAVEIEQAAWLGQEVEDLHPQRLNRGVHAAVSRVDDRQRVGRDVFHPGRDIPAGQTGHLQIEDRAVERFLGQGFQCRDPVFAHGDIVPTSRQFDSHDLADQRLVIDEQHTQLAARGSAQGSTPDSIR